MINTSLGRMSSERDVENKDKELKSDIEVVNDLGSVDSEMFNVVLLGKPGAGKGSQSDLICKSYDLKHISTGDLFRALMADKDNELGNELRDFVENGKLVPDEITEKILLKSINEVKDNIKNHDNNEFKGVLLDGFPRNLNQGKWLLNNVPIKKVIFLDVRDEIIIERLSARRICPKCHRVYNLITNPPKNDNVCDVCGVKLVQRNDDEKEVVEERLRVYNENTAPLISFFEEKGVLVRINGEKSVSEVFDDIKNSLGRVTSN